MTTVDFQNDLMWRHSKRGRPVLWESALVKIFGSYWMKIAISPAWQDSKSKYVDGAYDTLSIQTLEKRFSKQGRDKNLLRPTEFEKKPRQVEWEAQAWTLDGHNHRLEVCGDSKVIVNWSNGVWPVKFLPYSRRISNMHRQLHEIVEKAGVRPLHDGADFCRHVFRELNGAADEQAGRHHNAWHLEEYAHPANCVRGFFDGSVKGKKAAFGWVVMECASGDDDMTRWKTIASKSGCLPDGATITAAELEGSLSLVSFLQGYFHSYAKALNNISTYLPMSYHVIRSLVLADLV